MEEADSRNKSKMTSIGIFSNLLFTNQNLKLKKTLLYPSLKIPINLFYSYGCFACTYICARCACSTPWTPWDQLQMAVLCSYWESNLDPLKNQSVHLTTVTSHSNLQATLCSNICIDFLNLYLFLINAKQIHLLITFLGKVYTI